MKFFDSYQNKITMLRKIKVFSSLNIWDLRWLSKHTRLLEFRKSEIIYHQNDPADALYLIVSGRIKVFSAKSVIGREDYLHEGSYFGEISLLTNKPHSASVEVCNDALLLKIEKNDFNEMIKRIPQLGVHFSRRLSLQIRTQMQSYSQIKESKIISVCSAKQHSGRTTFALNLAAAIHTQTRQNVILIDISREGNNIAKLLKMSPIFNSMNINEIDMLNKEGLLDKKIFTYKDKFNLLGIKLTSNINPDIKIIPALLAYLVIKNEYMVIDISCDLKPMVMEILYQSDKVCVLSSDDSDSLTNTLSFFKKIRQKITNIDEKSEIVLNKVNKIDKKKFKNEQKVLLKKISLALIDTPLVVSYALHKGEPLVFANPDALYSQIVSRAARRLTNRTIGLALGCGSAMGLAHIGVIKVLEKEKIPIDIIAGSSMGALIGSMWAIGKNAFEIERYALGFTNKLRALWLADLALPISGIVKGKHVVKSIKTMLGNKTFEDLKIPLRILATNLDTRKETVFDRNMYLYEAVRASSSIPGIFRPVKIERNIYIDGGISAPCPINTLSEEGVNKIIAVNVLPSPEAVIHGRKIIKEKDELLRKKAEQQIISKIKYKFKKMVYNKFYPNLFDIMVRSMQFMEYEIAEHYFEQADIVIQPVIPDANWIEFYNAPKFIKAGEDETYKAMDDIKKLVG